MLGIEEGERKVERKQTNSVTSAIWENKVTKTKTDRVQKYIWMHMKNSKSSLPFIYKCELVSPFCFIFYLYNTAADAAQAILLLQPK